MSTRQLVGRLVNPFEREGKWYKANLHTHTTTSDGNVSVVERIKQYQEKGYSILALTDHLKTNDVTLLSSEGFLVLSGMETHPLCPGGDPYHLVCLNISHPFDFPEATDANERIALVKKAGGEVIVGHPYWCGHNLNQLLPLAGYIGIEVYNATCTRIGKGFSSVHWDDLLDVGVVTPAVASDDVHSGGRDIFMGWTMVKAQELTPDSIMESLRSGCYYASCGPIIEDFRLKDNKVGLKCSPVQEIHFICQRSNGLSFYAEKGKEITEAEIQLTENIKYVRAEVVDRQGRHAWTNPFIFND